MRLYLDLTKSGIVVFVLFSGAAGFLLSHEPSQAFPLADFLLTLLSLYGFSSGSFVFNQVQEASLDGLMERTNKRPLPAGLLSSKRAVLIGWALLLLGVGAGAFVNSLIVILGILSVLLYNGFYTLIWKRRWVFGAVPGAIPGAMPVVIGFAANSAELWRPELLYAFLIMFLWQMPHYWILALRYRDEYRIAGFPVMPAILGKEKALYFIGLYTFAYVGLALTSPLYTSARYAYLLIVIPFALKVVWEFLKLYRRADRQQKWLPFFLWTTFSVLVFLIAPVLDKWQYYLMEL